jgi:branched-chain amino acid transport system ATP-binding protein
VAELICRSIGVQFGGLQALHDVDLRIPPGHVSGLIGPNGAGKTTLFNVITGLQPPNAGYVALDGRDITRVRPARRAKLGVARTFQRLELFGSLTTRENIQMAAETQRTKLPEGASPLTEAQRLIERVGLKDVADVPTDVLPTGQARLVELARALATQPDILLLDEPSAGLNPDETTALGDLLTDLARQGIAVLLVEHDMSLVMSVSHTVSVLDFGRVIACGPPDTVRADQRVQAAYLGTDADGQSTVIAHRHSTHRITAAATSMETRAPAQRETRRGDVVIEFEDVRAAYGRIEVIHGVSVAVRRGTVMALLGPNGAGKSTLLKVASGVLPTSAGRVVFNGQPIRRPVPEQLVRQGICTIPEGRAVFPNLTVLENLRMFTYTGQAVTLHDLEEQTYHRFPLLGERRHQLAGRLSGGEQQMLALTRALYSRPELLFLDELSMGLAPLVLADLYAAVVGLVVEEQLTVLLVEQFATTALAIADEACVMVSGEIVDRGSPSEIGGRLSVSYLGIPEKR